MPKVCEGNRVATYDQGRMQHLPGYSWGLQEGGEAAMGGYSRAEVGGPCLSATCDWN